MVTEYAHIVDGEVDTIIVIEDGQKGLDFLKRLDGEWVPAQYKNKSPAKIGCSYNKQTKKFIGRKPHPNYIWDNDKEQWKAPLNTPIDKQLYKWNEKEERWDFG